MLLIALAWVYTLLLSYSFGHILSCSILKKGGCMRPEVVIFTGVAFLSAVAAILSLAIKIGLVAHVMVVFGALIFWYLRRAYFVPLWRELWLQLSVGNRWVLAAKIIGSLCLMLMSVQVPSHGDSDFYHAQAVQWASQYLVIPGLGNLFGRLAFNSALFPLQALFSFDFLLHEPLHLVNSFLIWIFFLWLINLCYLSSHKQSNFFIFYLVFLFASFLLFRGWVSSAAPDIAAGIFVWVALLLCLQEQKNLLSHSNLCAVTISCITAVTIKISTLPILLLPALLLLAAARKRNFRLLGTSVILSLFILTPFLVRNVIISGYLLYPVPALDLFSVAWKIPEELVVREKNIIHAFARIPGKPAAEVLSLSMPEWLPNWIAMQPPHDLAILVIVLLVPVFLFLTNAWQKLSMPLITSWVVLYSGTIFWLINAPSFRFGYAFLVPALGLSVWYFVKDIQPKITSKYLNASMAGLMLMLVVFALYLTKKSGLQLPESLYSPAPYPGVITKPHFAGTVEIRIPTADGNCGNAPVPCINQELLHPKLRLLGTKLEDGFYIANQ